uniref:Uncharacterized protein n=1 Tax=Ditylenchus dipsaci TaxID=166011 RepID=A0A915E8L7_9BILA
MQIPGIQTTNAANGKRAILSMLRMLITYVLETTIFHQKLQPKGGVIRIWKKRKRAITSAKFRLRPPLEYYLLLT